MIVSSELSIDDKNKLYSKKTQGYTYGYTYGFTNKTNAYISPSLLVLDLMSSWFMGWLSW